MTHPHRILFYGQPIFFCFASKVVLAFSTCDRFLFPTFILLSWWNFFHAQINICYKLNPLSISKIGYFQGGLCRPQIDGQQDVLKLSTCSLAFERRTKKPERKKNEFSLKQQFAYLLLVVVLVSLWQYLRIIYPYNMKKKSPFLDPFK